MAGATDRASEGVSGFSNLILIGLSLIAVSIVAGILIAANTKLGSFQTKLEGIGWETYHGKTITGDSVIAAIEEARSPAPKKIEIEVITLADTTGTSYGYPGNTGSYTEYTAPSPSTDTYINPTGLFKGEIEKNTNNVVIKVIFTQE